MNEVAARDCEPKGAPGAAGGPPAPVRGAPLGDEANARLSRAYGWLLRRLLGWAFLPVWYPEEGVAQLRALHERGVVVHVARSAAIVTFLYFQHLMVRLGLPAIQAVAGLAARIWRPWGALVAGRRRVRAPRRDDVAGAVKTGRSAMVFLRRTGSLGSMLAFGGLRDPFPALVAAQRTMEKPVLLVPQILLWNRAPLNLRRGLLDLLFGEPEAPGFWRSLVSLLRNRRRAFVKAGDPVDLKELVLASPGLDDAAIARLARGRLHQQLTREARVVTGPALKPARRIAMETLRDRSLRAVLVEVARERGRADGSVEREAARDLREIAARFTPAVVALFKRSLDGVFHRIYDGVLVDEAGFARVLKAAKQAPVALCPSHKSYIDFLIMSYLFVERGLVPPHIAAGINMSFWPMGVIFRRSGAFFIRRSFKGDRVYSAVLKAYVRKLVKDGFPMEYFVEGGRSRTGKVLLPRFGMLAMHVDAWVDGVRPDLAFCPAWIGYEKIIEAKTYASELGGEEKKQEDIRSLLRAPAVLASRFGRLHVKFAEPLSLAALAAERGFDRARHTEEEKRGLVRALAFRVVEGINRSAAVTPTGLLSTALLAHDRRGLAAPDLVERMEFLLARAGLAGGQPSFTADGGLDPRRPGPIVEALGLLGRDGSVTVHETGGEHIYAVPEEHRIRLDYYKNNVLHFFVPEAVVATAVLTSPSAGRDVVEARAKDLSRLFKNEFVFEAGKYGDVFARNVARLGDAGLHENSDGSLRPDDAGAPKLRLLAELLVNFVEGYAAASEALALLLEGPRDAREWMKLALERGRASYLAGRLRRRESVSKAIYENAFQLFEDRGIVVREGEKGRQRALSPQYRTKQAVDALAADVRSFLVRAEG